MYSHICGVDVADCEPDTFTKPQTHAVQGEKENLIAQLIGSQEELSGLFYRENVGNSGRPGRLDQRDLVPGFIQYIDVEKFQAVKIKFYRIP